MCHYEFLKLPGMLKAMQPKFRPRPQNIAFALNLMVAKAAILVLASTTWPHLKLTKVYKKEPERV